MEALKRVTSVKYQSGITPISNTKEIAFLNITESNKNLRWL